MQVEKKVKNVTRSVKILSPLKSSKKQEEKKQNKKTKTNQEKTICSHIQPFPAKSSNFQPFTNISSHFQIIQPFTVIYSHLQPFTAIPAIDSHLQQCEIELSIGLFYVRTSMESIFYTFLFWISSQIILDIKKYN